MYCSAAEMDSIRSAALMVVGMGGGGGSRNARDYPIRLGGKSSGAWQARHPLLHVANFQLQDPIPCRGAVAKLLHQEHEFGLGAFGVEKFVGLGGRIGICP